MKIKPTDYDALKTAVQDFVTEYGVDKIKAYRAVASTESMFRWELLRGSRFSTSGLYKYLNDANIDTALKAIIKGMEL